MRMNAAAVSFLLVLAVLCAACAQTKAPRDQGGGAVMTRVRPGSVRASGWLDLRELSAHTDAEKDPPREPYVRGDWIGGFFDARGDVVGTTGDPPKGRSVTRGWLELRTRAFFRGTDSRPRTPPWIEGARDDDTGGFFPATQVRWTNP